MQTAGSWRSILYKVNLGLAPSRSRLSCLFFAQGWLRTMLLSPPQNGGPCTGSMMVTRVSVLGVVCFCPEIQLSWEPPADGQPVNSLFPKSNLGSDLQTSSHCSGPGQMPCCLDYFSSWCVLYHPSLLWIGRTSYLVEGVGGKGEKEAIFWVLILSYIGLPNLGIMSLQVVHHGLTDRATDPGQWSVDLMAIGLCGYVRLRDPAENRGSLRTEVRIRIPCLSHIFLSFYKHKSVCLVDITCICFEGTYTFKI